jgi:anaphase-promoting complex subunit 4
MLNISEVLEEKGQGGLMQNLYHLACTGNCPEPIKEWLVDELQENGHKRWDNTVVSSLSTVIQLLHENFLPAVDRCTVVLSRLRGLAKYHDSVWIFNTTVPEFTALLELLKNMRLLAHTAILYASDEKRHFQFFSKWLRYQVDFQATEPGSQSRREMEAKDPGVDIAIVLEYIRYGLSKSDLGSFLQSEEQLDETQRNARPSSYPETVKAIDLAKDLANYKAEALCLGHVLHHFHTDFSKLFQRIGHWQENNTTMDCGIVLEEDISVEEGISMDMRMVFEVRPHNLSPAIRIYHKY